MVIDSRPAMVYNKTERGASGNGTSRYVQEEAI